LKSATKEDKETSLREPAEEDASHFCGLESDLIEHSFLSSRFEDRDIMGFISFDQTAT